MSKRSPIILSCLTNRVYNSTPTLPILLTENKMILNNLYIVYKPGRIFYSKNFKGSELDNALVLGFSSAASNFTKTLLSQDIREVLTEKSRVVYRDFSDFTFVAHADFSIGSSAVQSLLKDLGGLCEVQPYSNTLTHTHTHPVSIRFLRILGSRLFRSNRRRRPRLPLFQQKARFHARRCTHPHDRWIQASLPRTRCARPC